MSDAERIKRLENVLGTLITWIAQSAGSPLNRSEAEALLIKLHKTN